METSTIEKTVKPDYVMEKKEDLENMKGPVGLDIGTTNIIVTHLNGKSIKTISELNAFYTIPFTKISRRSLLKDGVKFFDKSRHV